MAERTVIAVTGADGLIGSLVVHRLDPGRFEVRGLTRDVADITDLAALERALRGADALVHLAAASDVGAAWDELVAPNLVGAYNAFEAARRAGVRRVVYASSNHVVGMYQRDDAVFLDPLSPREVGTGEPVRPDSLYGATKAWGEALGRYFAERHGLEVVCLRIGWVTDDDRSPIPDASSDDPAVARRGPGMWLSHRDCVSLVAASLTADVDFAIVNGVSDNAGRWLSLDEGRRLLGWQPQDGVR